MERYMEDSGVSGFMPERSTGEWFLASGHASAASTQPTLPIDETFEEARGRMMAMMSRGMTTKNFDHVRYSGRWFEAAFLKRGFAGQGQEHCRRTQLIMQLH